MSISTLEAKISELNSKLQIVHQKIKPLQDMAATYQSEIKKLNCLLSKEQINSDMSFEEKIEFFLFENGFSSDDFRYKSSMDFFNNELNLHISGWNSFSKQKLISFQLSSNSETDLDKIYSSISSILHIVKPMDSEGNKYFSITTAYNDDFFEPLSIKVSKNNEFFLLGSRNNVKKQFTDLFEALSFVKNHHYYESTKSYKSED